MPPQMNEADLFKSVPSPEFPPPTGHTLADPPGHRRILLLQGLMGPLFRRLGQGLRAAGHDVHKVNFNGGDRLYWRLPNGIDFRGTLDDWPKGLAKIIATRAITDVILFGDCRPHHILATQICREQGVAVHVFEEGYIRPDWVTLEREGVNGHSNLPRDPEWFRRTAALLPPVPEHRQVPSSFRRRALEGLLYNLADVATRWYYSGWHNHRPWPPLVEGKGWLRKLRQRKLRDEQTARVLDLLHKPTMAPFYLFPLQLDSDAQIRLHSPFSGMVEALRTIIGSFSSHAPAETRLLIKEHPLDNWVQDWQQITFAIGREFGVDHRIDYLPGGDIVPVAQKSIGMVTVNSTSGTLGLMLEKPVVVLGSAVYNIAGITFQDGLDQFWKNPVAPDQETFAAFRRVLIDRCLIPGGFFSDEALDMVVRHAIARFEGRQIPVE